MLEAAILAPEGVEHSLHYLRSRILARHTHAMLKRGVTLVTVYLEPGMRASGLNLCLLDIAVGVVGGLHPLLRRTLDRGGRLQLGAARLVPGRLARHGPRQGLRPFGGNVCRRSRGRPRLLRRLRGDGSFGAPG